MAGKSTVSTIRGAFPFLGGDMRSTFDRLGPTAIGLLLAALSLGLAGCEKKGPLEEAGDAIEEGAEDVREDLEDAAEEVEDAAEDVEDALRDR
jgi:predicted small lipoprotein YifL